MRDRVILPMDGVDSEYQDQCRDLARSGLDPKNLMRYGFYYLVNRYLELGSDYRTLRSYLMRDVVGPSHADDPRDRQMLLHRCLDHVQLIDHYVMPHIHRLCGRMDHTVRLEGFIGEDLVISFEHEEALNPYGHAHVYHSPYPAGPRRA